VLPTDLSQSWYVHVGDRLVTYTHSCGGALELSVVDVDQCGFSCSGQTHCHEELAGPDLERRIDHRRRQAVFAQLRPGFPGLELANPAGGVAAEYLVQVSDRYGGHIASLCVACDTCVIVTGNYQVVHGPARSRTEAGRGRSAPGMFCWHGVLDWAVRRISTSGPARG